MEPNNHENDGGECDWKPRVRMTFATEQEAYDFYNTYGGRLGFSIRRGYVNKSKDGQITSRQFVCNKEGFRVVDKRDPLTKNPRQEVRTGCQARLVIKWDRNMQKFFVSDFVEQHNHIFVPTECTHMLPSQRKISASQATEIDLAEKFGIRLNAAFELMGNEVGGRESLGFTKLDQKIIEDEEEFTLKWEEMLDKYEVRDNHWLKLTFGVKEKWGWPYVRNAWGAGMSSTQLSESFNAFLKDFIQSDHNLMQFFMHFDRVLSEKRYKELQTEYALCQKLPMVNIKVKIMEQAADVYTNKIFEEFQDEYVKSLEVNIEEIENDGESTVYTVLDSDGIKVRKVRQECDDSVTCSCRKFEMKGILCSHCLKILRERLKFKEIPSQYILKRWTKKARSENVKDRCGHDIQVDVRLHQTSRYRSLMAIFRAVACRAS